MGYEDQKSMIQSQLYKIKDGSLIHLQNMLSDGAERLNRIIDSNEASRFGVSGIAAKADDALSSVQEARRSLDESIDCIAKIETEDDHDE